MKISLRPLGGAGLLLSTAIATASPILLDTEQKAAAAFETTLFKAEVPRQVNGNVDNVVIFTDVMLRMTKAATTPAALLSTPAGITIPCGVSGSFKARLPDAQPRVLHLRFTDCKARPWGVSQERTFNGTAALTLPGDTFQPQSLPAVRFGNDSAELLIDHHTETPNQREDVSEAFNIALRGDISMGLLFDSGAYVSSFRMNGYTDQRATIESPLGTPPYFLGYKMTAEHLSVLHTVSVDGEVTGDDTQFLSGSVAFTQTQPPPYGVLTDAYQFNDYRVNRVTNWGAAWNEQLSIDGRIAVTFNPFWGAGCTNGLYAMKTRVPLFYSLDTPSTFQSGELVVNGAVAKFYSAENTPPGLPVPVNGMLVNLRVHDVGTFNYDAVDWFQALSPVGACY
jgi:hypothetical protein